MDVMSQGCCLTLCLPLKLGGYIAVIYSRWEHDLTVTPGRPLSPGNPLSPGGPSFPGLPRGPGSPCGQTVGH